MGFNRNTARSIIFGPIDQGGGKGHGDTETMQGQAHLDLFLSHLRAKDQTGNVLRISLETLNLFLGLPKYPLTYDYKIIQKYHEPICGLPIHGNSSHPSMELCFTLQITP